MLGRGDFGSVYIATNKLDRVEYAVKKIHILLSTLWRIRKSVFIVLPPFIMSYLIFTETEKEHDRLQRKQPGQFDHETRFSNTCHVVSFSQS